MKQFLSGVQMEDYIIILNIIEEVFIGKNLSEIFAKYINETKNSLNIGKIKDISYGLLRYYNKIDNILKILIKKKPNNDKVLIILLIAIYEVNYSKKPKFAICNDLVNFAYFLTKSIKLKNFINGVIRNYLRNIEYIEKKLESNIEYKYNFPLWWIEKLKKDIPKNYNEVLSNLNVIPKLALRINLKKIKFNDYLQLLKKENLSFKIIDNKIVLEDNLNINQIPLFKNGTVSVQDISAQKLLDLINFNDGDYVLDACSAPGGKSCQILENNKVELIALDINENRLKKVKENFERLNLSAKIVCADASNLKWWDNKKFDVIIADVPCSASGTIRKNPDIKLHRKLADIQNFVYTQQKIVLNLWQTLKINGQLVYITCSIFKEENQENIKNLIKKMKNSKIIKELFILPTEFSDGFYYCILEKIS